MKKRPVSFAVRLSLGFMFILTSSVILLSLSILFFLRSLVRSNQKEGLVNAADGVYSVITRMYENGELNISDNAEEQRPVIIPEIPYFISYIVYDVDTEKMYATNDPFLPLLKDTKGKAKRYFAKNFFFDGDLDVVYYAETFDLYKRKIVVAVSENNEKNFLNMIFTKLPFALLFMIIPILLLSFFVSLFITKNTISPVVKITKTARTMTTENLDGQLPLSGRRDELDELSQAFNELFLRIKADFDRERQFSSDVSHELNTPLTVISGQANLLLRWGKDNPEQLEKSLLAIKDEAKSMHAIIENLLQMSRVESGRVKPQICEVSVCDLFERVRAEFSAVAPEVKFVIETQAVRRAGNVDVTGNVNAPENADESGSAAAVVLNTDPEMLHQILTVLVSNSVKFAGEKCTVKLGIESAGVNADGEEGRLVIFECDDGPGIAEETVPHVFERFYRGDEAHSRSAGGCGLGLAIAKTLCGALGAEIAAGNVEPHGAKFSIAI